MVLAFACRYGKYRFLSLNLHLQGDAETAAPLPIPGRIPAEFVPAKEQRKTRFHYFYRAELETAATGQFTDIRPAVSLHRGAGARAGVEHVPDKRFAGARIDALERDAVTLAPAGHDAIRTGRGQRLDDSLGDLL